LDAIIHALVPLQYFPVLACFIPWFFVPQLGSNKPTSVEALAESSGKNAVPPIPGGTSPAATASSSSSPSSAPVAKGPWGRKSFVEVVRLTGGGQASGGGDGEEEKK